MAVKDDLGNRMKDFYENRSKTYLIKKMPVIIRLDGKSFHQFTRGFKKPFDEILIKTMQDTMKYLCENIQGCVLGYTQSDEITLVLVDYQTPETDAWFDYSVQKICSVASSMATLYFNQIFRTKVNEYTSGKTLDEYAITLKKAVNKGATFDARTFNIPKEEVTNCIYWRQVDAERNSRMGLCQAYYSQKQLNGLSSKDAIAKLDAEKGIVWGDLPTTYKRGSCCIRENQLLNYKLLQITKTDFPEILQLEVGDLSKEMIKKLKEKILNIESLKGYENLGLIIEDTIYIPTPDGDSKVFLPTVTDLGKWVIDDEIPRFVNEGREYIEKLITF